MRELRSPGLMKTKAALFLVLVLLCTLSLWLQSPEIRTIVLALALAWSASRLYYFLFYVLHAYVDPSLKYSGILALLRTLALRRGRRPPARRVPESESIDGA